MDWVCAPTVPRRGILTRYLLLLVIASSVVLLDQLSKSYVERHLQWRPFQIMPGFDIHYARNPGAAWGILSKANDRFRRPFLVGFSVFATALILITYQRATLARRRRRWGLALILGGALGNLIDRVAQGYVVDFIDWHAHIFGRVRSWPTFNVADAAITIGLFLLILDLVPGYAAAQERGASGAPGVE